MFENIKTKSDFVSLNQKDKEMFLNILAGACVKQKEENNQIVDYYDYEVLEKFGLSGNDLDLPDLKFVDIDLSLKKTEKNQFCLNLLESTFETKTVEIKAIACDKTGSNEYIKSQYEIYETMYSNAKASYYSSQLNEEIITANETAKQLTAPMIMLVNEIRHEFQRLITFEVEVKKELELFRDTPISKTDNTSLNQLHTKLKGM